MAASKARPAPISAGPPRRTTAAVILLAVGIIVTISLLGRGTHDPATHVLGEAGSVLSDGLLTSLGVGAHVIAISWYVLGVSLVMRGELSRWLTRVIGWMVLAVAAAILADLIAPMSESISSAGPGGTVGAGLSLWLSEQFPLVTRLAFVTSLIALGLYLAADVAIVWLTKQGWRIVRAGSRLFARRPQVIVSRPRAVQAKPPLAVEARDVPISRSLPEPKAVVELPAKHELPPHDLLEDPEPFPHEQHDEHLRATAALLEKTFADFSLNVRVVGIHTGPVITQYEIALETGLRVSKVTSLGDDLALNLKVPSVRIIAPIPGKNTVGIEVPNEHRAVVRIKEIVLAATQKVAKSRLPLFLGKDTEGRPLVFDLAEMPHLLIAGRTGTGKSVCLNAVILSLLLTKKPDECRLIMIDPKQVEFSDYTRLPHLMCPVVTQNSKAEAILAWAVDKMEERYSLLASARVRNIAAYNTLGEAEIARRVKPSNEEDAEGPPGQLPYIVIIIDEIGDLMMEMKKEVESHIIRLAQKSRAAGIHLILATQKPTVDVITGLIKSNLPARICFQVSSRSDSRVVLDEMGADKLLGKGDMLFLQPGTSTLIRAQGAYASDQEILRIVSHLECDPDFVPELLELKPRPKDGDSTGPGGPNMKARDPLYEQAVEVIVREGRGSVSLLQRALGIGYGKAARFIDYMAEDGIVGHYNGSQAREVLVSMDQWEEMRA